jgi:hypothetical protein
MTISQGVETEDFFGFAAGKDGDKYLGFAFGRSALVNLDPDALLIEKIAAHDYKDLTKPKPQPVPEIIDPDPGKGIEVIVPPKPIPEPEDNPPVVSHAPKHQFYGTVDINPIKAKIDFATIMDEVVQQFTARVGVEVEISVEIRAKSKEGFDESVQRTIRENCHVLKFNNSEFD